MGDKDVFSGLANDKLFALSVISWSIDALHLIGSDGNACIVNARVRFCVQIPMCRIGSCRAVCGSGAFVDGLPMEV